MSYFSGPIQRPLVAAVTVVVSSFSTDASDKFSFIGLSSRDCSTSNLECSTSFNSLQESHSSFVTSISDSKLVEFYFVNKIRALVPHVKFWGRIYVVLLRLLRRRKYRTLLLKSNLARDSGKVIDAITYQIIPANTEYAEIPLASVNAIYQRKGFGRLLFLKLKKRLQNVGIHSNFCWGDKESEGFWLKQVIFETSRLATIVNGVLRKTTHDMELNGVLRKITHDMSLNAKVLMDDNPQYAIECADVGIKLLLLDYENSYPWSKDELVDEHLLVTKVKNRKEVEQQLTSLIPS